MSSLSTPTAFAHPVEEQFARLLDFYGIAWQYEPHLFELEYHEDGALKRAFVPDFYLPQSDTYIELTTMGQRQITRKHRKLRRLKERYPEVRIRLFGRKHLQELWARFGLIPGPDGCPLDSPTSCETRRHEHPANLSTSA